MRKQLLMFVSLFMMSLLFTHQGIAETQYQVTYMYVQHRVYEDSTKGQFNRLWFSLQDDVGNYAGEDFLEDAVLIDPDGNVVELTDRHFDPSPYISGSYDGSAGQWRYNPQFLYEPGFYFKFKQPIKNGIYYLETTYNGFTSEASLLFNGLVALPVVKASSIKLPKKLDSAGNLILEWTPSNDLYWLTDKKPKLTTSERVQIDIYKDGNYVSYVYITVPTHMGRAFIPKWVIDKMKSVGDVFKLMIHLRTQDNNNRTYSNEVDLTPLLLSQ
jgi:hypothetical protein